MFAVAAVVPGLDTSCSRDLLEVAAVAAVVAARAAVVARSSCRPIAEGTPRSPRLHPAAEEVANRCRSGLTTQSTMTRRWRRETEKKWRRKWMLDWSGGSGSGGAPPRSSRRRSQRDRDRSTGWRWLQRPLLAVAAVGGGIDTGMPAEAGVVVAAAPDTALQESAVGSPWRGRKSVAAAVPLS